MTSVHHDELASRAAVLRRDRVPFVHARVVLADRPTSAKPGDEAIVLGDGTLVGFVGGTCAESTVRAQSLVALDTGEPLLLRITPVEEPAQPGKLVVHNPCLSGGTLEVFLEPVRPAPLVAVAGGSPIAIALRRIGAAVGYEMLEVTDDAVPEDATAVVVASHGRDEESVLTAALRAGVPYVGLVASRKRGDAVLAALEIGEGASRVHTPAGLDLGARSPEEVAVSIIAEIVATRPRPAGRPLPTGEAAGAAPTAVDVVCGMTVAADDVSLHLDHDGRRYWFCGTGCLRAFAADPAQYTNATP